MKNCIVKIINNVFEKMTKASYFFNVTHALRKLSLAWKSCRPRGVTVNTQDSESCDPSSNLGGTSLMYCKVKLAHVSLNPIISYKQKTI